MMTLLLTAALLAQSPAAQSTQILDRLALSVGADIITEQDILLSLRIAAFLNEDEVHASGSDKRRAAQKLLELALIQAEMENNGYPLPTAQQVDSALNSILTQRFDGDRQAFTQALQRYRITETQLRDSLRRQLATISFIDFRFRPGVQISEDEMRDYYQYNYPLRDRQSYEQARLIIQEEMTQQRIDSLLDRWLNQTESSTRIRWVESVFMEPQP
jgi:hypothetical protein